MSARTAPSFTRQKSGLLTPERIHLVALRAARQARPMDGQGGLLGFGAAILFSEEGDVLQENLFCNLVTDVGDTYYAAMGCALVTPATPAHPTLACGMKLGTGSTAVAKSGAGAALVTYPTGITADKAFDATFPSSASLGGGLGANISYQTTWTAGQATTSGLNEAVIVNESSLTDTGNAAATTIARTILSSTVNKGASDTLAILWTHKSLGA